MDVLSLSLSAAASLVGAAALVGVGLRWWIGPEIPAAGATLAGASCFTIWTHPGATIRRALDRGSIGGALVITGLAGLLDCSAIVLRLEPGGTSRVTALGLGALLGPWIGLAYTGFLAAVWTLCGRLLGGVGRFRLVFQATAYPMLISIWVALFTFPALFLPQGLDVSREADLLEAPTRWLVFQLTGLFLQSTSAVWTFALLVSALAEAHAFSRWRALATLVLGVFAVLGLFLWMVFFLLVGWAVAQ